MATVGLSVDSSSAQSLLDQLFNELYVNEKDEIAYKSWFRFDHLLPVFSSYMRIGELTSEEKNKLIRSCITQLRRTKKRDLNELIRTIELSVAGVLQVSPKKYYMTSTISLRRVSANPPIKMRIAEADVQIGGRYPSEVKSTSWFYNGFGHVQPATPNHYARLCASTKAKTTLQAAQTMINAFDFLTALLNFSIQRGSISIFGGRLRPYNDIRLGEFQVIHDDSGNILQDFLWYDPEFYVSTLAAELPRPDKIREIVRLSGRLERSVLREPLRGALLQYNAALSIRDRHSSLMKLWSALELLTGTTKLDNKRTVKRALFLLPDREYFRLILDYAATARNSYVHLGVRQHQIDDLINALKLAVEQLIYKLLSFRWKLDEPEMLFQLMDMPTRLDELGKRLRVTKLSNAIQKEQTG
jgi:hypothetical protein